MDMIQSEINPIALHILVKEENGDYNTFTVENTPEGSVAFQIALDTLFREGGEYCTKHWVSELVEFRGVSLDIKVGDTVVTI